MIFALKKKNPYAPAAMAVLKAVMGQVRRPEFYTRCGVPDTFDGRFDVMVLHLFLVMEPLMPLRQDGRDFNQALFDAAFSNMDQTLREMGIGDMSVPKHMRRMMKAFNGRVHAYYEAFDLATDEALESVLRRNIYAVSDDVVLPGLPKLMAYCQTCRLALGRPRDILQGVAIFPSV